MSNVFIEVDGEVTNLTEGEELSVGECLKITNDMRVSSVLDVFKKIHDVDVYIED